MITLYAQTGSGTLSIPLLQAGLARLRAARDSAGGAQGRAARTRGGALAGGATRIRGASGSERPSSVNEGRLHGGEDVLEVGAARLRQGAQRLPFEVRNRDERPAQRTDLSV